MFANRIGVNLRRSRRNQQHIHKEQLQLTSVNNGNNSIVIWWRCRTGCDDRGVSSSLDTLYTDGFSIPYSKTKL